MIRIDIDLDAAIATETLRELVSALTDSDAVSLNRKAGEAVRGEAAEYHREFDAAGGWKGKRYLGGNPRAGEFGARVAQGWMLSDVQRDGLTISNSAEHLSHKVTGGTITPKRARALTIPLIREASGITARDYVRITGNKLFTIKGKSALFERIDTVTSGSARGRRGQAAASAIRKSGIRPVFALVRSVTHRPWPNALPPEGRLADTYVRAYKDGLTEILET